MTAFADPAFDFIKYNMLIPGVFSNDEKWICLSDWSNNIYIFPGNEIQKEPIKPLFNFNYKSKIDANSDFIVTGMYPFPRFNFSPNSQFLAIENGFDTLYLIKLNETSKPYIKSGFDIFHMSFGPGIPNYNDLAFTDKNNFLVTIGKDFKIYTLNLREFPQNNFKPLNNPVRSNGIAPREYAKPNSDDLIIRSSDGSFYDYSGNSEQLKCFKNFKPDSNNYRGADVHFSSDNKWLTITTCEDSLCLWSSDYVINKTLLKMTPEKCRCYGFSPNSKFISVLTDEGYIQIWTCGDTVKLAKDIHIADHGYIDFKWCNDNYSYYIIVGENVYIGNLDDNIKLLTREGSNIQGIITSKDNKSVIIFGQYNLTFVQKKLYIFGIPVYSFKLPVLDENAENTFIDINMFN